MLRRSCRATEADRAACKAMLRAGSKSFAAASLLLPRRVREPSAALYAFCRMADDAVDLARDPDAVQALRRRVALAYAGTPADAPVDRAFAEVVLDHEVPRELVEAHLEGFAWDAEGRRYATISALHAYAARVAGAVGAMMTVLMGPRSREALARACDLGVAMQLTNIARDVGEDARNGRVYLPLEWLDEAGVDAGALIARPRHSPALAAVLERLLDHADGLYARAALGIPMLPRDCRAAIRAASFIYADIGQALARRGYDAVSGRAVVPGSRKLWLVLRALLASERTMSEGAAPALAETQFLVDAVTEQPSGLLAG
ncbi:Phytoene synthase [Minicystis rosea]|nr:Phytoene synthase [Minicystis rosea]